MLSELERKFTELVNIMAPPLPEEIGGIKLRTKINETLAPVLLKKWLPPMPTALAKLLEGGRR